MAGESNGGQTSTHPHHGRATLDRRVGARVRRQPGVKEVKVLPGALKTRQGHSNKSEYAKSSQVRGCPLPRRGKRKSIKGCRLISYMRISRRRAGLLRFGLPRVSVLAPRKGWTGTGPSPVSLSLRSRWCPFLIEVATATGAMLMLMHCLYALAEVFVLTMKTYTVH